ncbi:MAG: hypothetical protein GTO14_18310 [Anaerolineales bacterium]|nr:hypothetical protein [Anaerolineales bacterium]
MTKQERTWCWIYGISMALITSLPYFLGFAMQGEDWRFTGFVFAVEDGNSYIAKMLSGSIGDWLFRTPYTSTEQAGVIAYLPFLILGKLASGAAIHEQLVVLYHLFRITAIPLVVFATYRFVALFLQSIEWRRWGTVLATVGGGLGWVLMLFGNTSWLGSLPLEFYSPEAFGFLSIYGLPHLVLARALMLFGLSHYLVAVDTPRSAWIASVFFLCLTLVQPLSVLSSYAVIAVHQIILLLQSVRRRKWRNWLPWLSAAIRSGVVALPVVGYLIFSFSRDPFLRNWTAQNRILSPHPFHYLLAYGLLLGPAIIGAGKIVERKDEKGYLPIAWVAALPLLAYAPYNLQRRLPEGVWVAIVLLAVLGLSSWLQDRGSAKRWVVRACVGVSLISSFMLIIGGIGVTLRKGEPVFRSTSETRAFQALGELVEVKSVVLTSYPSGNAIPAWSPVRVVVGHGPESANLDTLLPQVEDFYRGTMDEADAIRFLDEQDVRYVWVGPKERALGSFDPTAFDELSKIFEEGEYTLYLYESAP